MKRIVAIVRTEKLEPLKEALFNADIAGMTISQVMGCGNQHGWSEYYRGTEVLLNMVPKVKFELVVDDDRVQDLVDIICETARTGEVGDGKVFVSPVEEVVRIRTGEQGVEAHLATLGHIGFARAGARITLAPAFACASESARPYETDCRSHRRLHAAWPVRRVHTAWRERRR